MRNSLLFGSVMAIAGGFFLACTAHAQPQAPAQPQKPPISISPAISPAMPPADPAKMADPAGGKTPSVSIDGTTFVLGAEDVISVSMWDAPQFDGQYTIRPDGMISLKLLGEIKAAGLTPVQLQETIEKAALSQLRTPRCTVNVLVVKSKHLYFDGDGISQPGDMPLVIPIRLLEAISVRGGFKDFANKNKIHILRDGKLLKIGNSTNIKYSDMTSGKHPESNPYLRDGDHVIVN